MSDTMPSLGQMASLFARYASVDGDNATPVPRLFLYRQSAPTSPIPCAYRPGLSLVLQGAKSMTLASETYHYGAGQYLLNSLHLPAVAHVTQASVEQPHFCFSFAIDPEKLGEVLLRAPTVASPESGSARGVAVNDATSELLEAAWRLLRLLERPQDIPVMAPLIEQELLYRVLSGPDGARLLQIMSGGGQSSRIVRAVAWLRANFADPLRVEELAEHVNMSISSLHHHFKAVTAMSPMQYQKQLRLHEARRLMLAEGLDAGTASLRVGYQSPSQFSREYSRLYGLPPLRDVGRLREAV